MKSTLTLNGEFKFDFQQLVELAKKLPARQKKKLASILSDEEEYISKEEVIQGISEGLRDVKLHKEGKIELKTARQLLSEL